MTQSKHTDSIRINTKNDPVLWERTHEVSGWSDHCKVCVTVTAAGLKLSMQLSNAPEATIANLDTSFNQLGLGPGCNLQRGLHQKSASDCFTLLYYRVVRYTYGYIEGLGPLDRLGQSHSLRSFATFLKAAKRDFLSSLNSDRAKIARKFPTGRWGIYHWLTVFESERVLQLVETCPALIGIWAIGVDRGIFDPYWMSEIIDCVDRGESLKFLIESTFNLLWNSESTRFDCWKELRQHSARTRESIKADWIWIIRAAPAAANPNFLLMPPPVHLPKSTFPRKSRAQAKWLIRPMLMRSSWLPEAHGVSFEQIQCVLNLFVSKPEFYNKLSGYRQNWYFTRFLAATNRHPNTATKIDSLLAEFKRWITKNRSQNFRILKVLQHFPETFLHDFNFEYTDETLQIRTLNRYCDLCDEGGKMAHCVANEWLNALKGEVIHLHIDFKGTPYTMAIKRQNDEWALRELRGESNAEAPDEIFGSLQKPFVELSRYLRSKVNIEVVNKNHLDLN